MRKLSKEQVLLLHTQLLEEYAELLARKKEAYREYRKAKQEMTDFATTKYDIERFQILEKKRKPGRGKKQKQKQRRFSHKGHFIGIRSGGVPLFFALYSESSGRAGVMLE